MSIGNAVTLRDVEEDDLRSFLAHETTRPLHAYVAAHNLGSIRVLEKCAFGRVGDCTKGPDGVEEQLFQLDA